MAKKSYDSIIYNNNVSEARRRLMDLARGGDGLVAAEKRHFDPPYVSKDGLAYEWAVVAPPSVPGGEPTYYLVANEDQADKLLNLGNLGV